MKKHFALLLILMTSAEASGREGNRSLLSPRKQQIQCSSTIKDTRCKGNQLNDFTAISDPDTCCKKCQEDSDCNAWSWKTGKKCITMTACDKKESQDGSISGLADSPSPPPPSPPGPSPAPPSPSPGGLPDIPDVSIWVGFWGTEEYSKEAYDVSSFAFDNPSEKDIDKYGGGGLRFLYPAFQFFCKECPESKGDCETNTCTLFDDFEARWSAAVPKMTQLLKDGKIIGFSVGDERVCGDGGHGTSVADWEKIINTIRASFPDRRKAIIHANECGSTFGKEKDGDCTDDDFVKKVPAGLDWIEIDKYRNKPDESGFMQKIKDYYNACIYPKMQSNQKVCVTPESAVIDDKGYKMKESEMLDDAHDTVKWAESDDRVGCITVYRWDDMNEQGLKNIKKFWSDYASKSRPGKQSTILV